MPEITLQVPLIAAAAFLGIGALLVVLMAATLFSLRASQRERLLLNREIYGMLKKIEGLTATKREQVMKHYDKMLESLAVRLPATVAAHASQTIFETESKILSRLAELEPNLRGDEVSKRRMNELIKTMENLENTIVCLTSDTVKKVMLESRRDVLEDSDSLAA